jgi:hypothetical protein
MKDAGPKSRREDVGPRSRSGRERAPIPDPWAPRSDRSPPPAVAEPPRARKKVLVASAVAGTALALAAALWAMGRDSSGGAFAVAGVRAAAAHVDPAAIAPSADADAPPLEEDAIDEDAIDGGDPEEVDDDGDPFADWLAEAEARARLAAASHSAGAADSPPPAASADAGPAAAQPPLGHATRLRNIGLQLVAICSSGHAADVQPLALEVLQERPAPWLAHRIRAACFRETEPPPPDEPAAEP